MKEQADDSSREKSCWRQGGVQKDLISFRTQLKREKNGWVLEEYQNVH